MPHCGQVCRSPVVLEPTVVLPNEPNNVSIVRIKKGSSSLAPTLCIHVPNRIPHYTVVTLSWCSGLLCYFYVFPGRSDVQWGPSLAVHLVHMGALGQQKGHHLHAAVDASLCEGRVKTKTA